MGTTTNNAYPYPELTDSANVPRDMRALADAVDLSRNIASRAASALASTYPAGPSTMYVGSTDSATWPTGSQCVVLTSRTSNNVIVQWCGLWSAASTKVWVRNGTSTAWGPWVLTDSRGTSLIARGRTTVTFTNSATSAGTAVTLPASMFTIAPRVMLTTVGSSQVMAYLTGSPGASGFTAAGRQVDLTSITGPFTIDWIAVEGE